MKSPSLLATAYRYGVPIFVGAVQDGSIFLNIVKLKRLLGDEFKLEIDVNDDVFEMGAMQHHCFAHAQEADGRLDPRRRRARRTTRSRASRCSIRSSASRRTASTSTCSSASTRSTTARSARAPRARGTRGARSPPRAWRPASAKRPGSPSRCRNAATASPAKSCRPPTSWRATRRRHGRNRRAHGQRCPLRHLPENHQRDPARGAGGLSHDQAHRHKRRFQPARFQPT